VKSWKACALALVAAACGTQAQKPGARLAEPSSVAVYRGVTPLSTSPANPGTYLAIASGATNDLRIVDVLTLQPLLAPVQFAALSVPTGERPSKVVVASLNDGLPDALVAVPSGSAELDLVDTWTVETRVVEEIPLQLVAPGAQVLDVIGAPVPVLSGDGWVAQAGAARFLVALTGGRLAIVPVSRGGDGSIQTGDPVVVELRNLMAPVPDAFDVVSLAVSPDLTKLYCASQDPIGAVNGAGGVLGVVEITATDPSPASWRARGLSTRAPTILAGAFMVNERSPVSPEYFNPDRVLRVYAILDRSACGYDHPVPCGIAVVDPALGRIALDPAGQGPYLAPLPIPGWAVGMAFSAAPANGSIDKLGGAKYVDNYDGVPRLRIAPKTGGEYTPQLAVVPTTYGEAYWADLARFTLPSDTSVLRDIPGEGIPGATAKDGVSVPGAKTLDANGQVVDRAGAKIGVCSYWGAESCAFDETLCNVSDPANLPANQVRTDTAGINGAMGITPGYTRTDVWAIQYQGPLPDLEKRRGVLGRTADGTLYVAIQAESVVTGGTPRGVALLYDPTLAVHTVQTANEADWVDVLPDDTSLCDPVQVPDPIEGDPGHTKPDLTLARTATARDLLIPTADYPGGAIALADTLAAPSGGGCGLVANGTQHPATITVRAAGLVLKGTDTGYAGRPILGQKYALIYFNEDAYSCPVLDWAANPYFVAPPACDAACRTSCEHLILVRKARRLFYVGDICPAPRYHDQLKTDDPCLANGFGGPSDVPPGPFQWPYPYGPVIGFWTALSPSYSGDCDNPEYDYQPLAGAFVKVTTRSGLTPAGRVPFANGSTTGAALPTGVTTFDFSTLPGQAESGIRYYVSYMDNQVLVFSPAVGLNEVQLVR
jgi:hypothetical protein